jgi:phosphatidylglycerol lysyltransferase
VKPVAWRRLAPLIGIVLFSLSALALTRETRWGRASRRIAAVAAPPGLAVFTFASGVVLLFSGATPAVPARIEALARIMPLPLLEASHFTASLVGLGLLLLAQGIARRIDAAFYITAAALAVGSAASLLKGADYEEATLLALVLAGLVAARHHFTRRARVFEDRLSTGWLAAVGIVVAASVWLGSFAYRHVAFSSDLWWRFEFDADAPRFLRASVGVIVAALIVGVRELLRPAFPVQPGLETETRADIDRAIARQPRATPNLVYLGDKAILWNTERTAFLMYSVHGKSAVALGDPVGAAETARPLIAQFLEMCDRVGLMPVFYEASSDRLGDFADYGLTAAKIGEEARVPLQTFSLAGSTFKTLRTAINGLTRRGYTFRVADASEAAALMPELQDISDEWLEAKGASEKGFSLGYFRAEYLEQFPMALIEHDGRIDAFANLWTTEARVEVSLDLMRQRTDAPPGTMDALLAQLMVWGREQGYEWFNLGMAPLSGLPASPGGRVWTRFGPFIFRHGEAFYNFQGVRAYKEKFNPVWEPRYLVYPGGLTLARALADVAALVAGGYGRIFLRGGRRAA